MSIDDLKIRVGLFLGQFQPATDGNYTQPMSMVPDKHIKAFADFIRHLPGELEATDQPVGCFEAFKKRWPKSQFQDEEFYSLAFLVWNSCWAVCASEKPNDVPSVDFYEEGKKLVDLINSREGEPAYASNISDAAAALYKASTRERESRSGRQPIETAPKGVPVIVAGGLAMQKTGGEWFTGMEEPRYQRPLQWQPAWWMPIPTDNARRGS